MKNDVLGRVCNAHMALADLHGPSDFQCRELASLASQAVDFSKTGVAVQQSEIPRLEEYPDFMGKVRLPCHLQSAGAEALLGIQVYPDIQEARNPVVFERKGPRQDVPRDRSRADL